MSNLPMDFEGGLELPPEPGRGGLEKRRKYELTPAEKAIARHNRRWMMVIVIPTLVVGGIGIAVSLYAATRGPTVTAAAPPAGFQTIKDGYFDYSVPSNWSTSSVFSDLAGDLYNGGKTGWAAENLGTRLNRPVPGEKRPASFESFGENVPTPYQISPAVPTVVSGATMAYRYQITRPGGFTATAIDAWQSSTGAELWLMIHAGPAITNEIVASLRG